MIALPHRRTPEPPAPAKPCGSDAPFRVKGAGIYHYCGPHLHMGLTDHLTEATVIYDAEPGHSCEYTPEVSQ